MDNTVSKKKLEERRLRYLACENGRIGLRRVGKSEIFLLLDTLEKSA